jgi:hypothetical protein
MANLPPPYDDITGISRAVMKDNAQVTLAEYNGTARPGELVVDLTQDPPPLYVGNNAGQLTLVTSGGGGAGLPLANGTSNFNIATIDSSATITVDDGPVWTFDATGNVTVPGSIVGLATIRIDNSATGNTADIELRAADNILLQGKDFAGIAGGEREGGDININSGAGTDADNFGDVGGSGGDIRLTAGDGGVAAGSSGGAGGFITLTCGDGGTANAINESAAGDGASLTLEAGWGGNNDGDPGLGGDGGNVIIRAGNATNSGFAGNVLITAGTDAAGAPGEIVFAADRINRLIYQEATASLWFTPVTLATLGSAASKAGARAFVNDGNLVASGNFGAVISGSGANTVPVFSDGTNWRIG